MHGNELKPKLSSPSGNMRKLSNWLDGFEEYMKGRGSPALFVRWAGIFTLSSALERRAWVKTGKGILYPNMYVVSVGPPGAGKTLAMAAGREMLEEVEGIHIAPTSVTKASLIDAMEGAKRTIIRPQDNPSTISYNSLIVTSDELGVFLPAYENDFMNVLTNIYDCRIYSETRRTKNVSIKIDHPQLSLAAATTPSYLNALLPEGAWDQGFLSRTLLIYSGAEDPGDLFKENNGNEGLYKDLVYDLKSIGKFYGKFEWEPAAAEAMTAWHKARGEPVPDHPKLQHYNTRRTAHLLKLCMVASISSSSSGVITVENFVEALDWLVVAETAMPDIFKSMRSGGDGRVMEEAWHFVYQIYIKTKKAVSEQRLMRFISERTPAYSVERIIQIMEKQGQIKAQWAIDGESQVRAYIPGPKQDHP